MKLLAIADDLFNVDFPNLVNVNDTFFNRDRIEMVFFIGELKSSHNESKMHKVPDKIKKRSLALLEQKGNYDVN